jgi:hypothetical protein
VSFFSVDTMTHRSCLAMRMYALLSFNKKGSSLSPTDTRKILIEYKKLVEIGTLLLSKLKKLINFTNSWALQKQFWQIMAYWLTSFHLLYSST